MANKNDKMSNYRTRAAIACFGLCWVVLDAVAQEIPEFGSGAASGILVDAPVRARAVPAPPPEDGEEGALEEIITTGAARSDFRRNWSVASAYVHSDDRGVLGFDLNGLKKRSEGRTDQFLVGYSHINPDGTDGPFHQGKLRYRNKFAVFASGWALEGQAQLLKRWEKYVDESAQLNIGFRPYELLSLTLNAGYLRRERDDGETRDARDLRMVVRQQWPWMQGLAFTADYRLENDVTGEDDASLGAELRGWSLSLGKHGVATLSYVLELHARDR
jgi:hypothetical protein